MRRCLHVLARGQGCPHGVLRGQWRVTLDAGSQIPEGTRRDAPLRMSTLRWKDAEGSFAGRKSSPLMAIIQGLERMKRLFGLTIERSRKRVHKPVGHLSKLRRREALNAIEAPHQEICAQRRSQKGPDIRAQIFCPAAAVGVPCFDGGTRVVAGDQRDAFFPHVHPGLRLGVVGKEKRHCRRHAFDIGQKIGMAAEHGDERHEVVAGMDVSDE